MSGVKGRLKQIFSAVMVMALVTTGVPQSYEYVYATEQEESKQEEPKQEEPKQEEPQAPESSSQAPTEEPQAPESSSQAPTEEPQTPESTQEQPTEESQAPESSSQAPTEESQTPESTQEQPTEESQAPESSSQAPTEESQTSESTQEQSTEIPESTEIQTEEETESEEIKTDTTVVEELQTEESAERVEYEIEYKALAQKYDANSISVILMADVKNYTGDIEDMDLCWKYVSGDVFPDTSVIKAEALGITNIKVVDEEQNIRNFTIKYEITGLLAATKYTFKVWLKSGDKSEVYDSSFVTVTTASAEFSHEDMNFDARQSAASDIQIDYSVSVENTSTGVSAALYYKTSAEKNYTLYEQIETGAGKTAKSSIYELTAGKTYNLVLLARGMKKELSVTMSNVSVAVLLPSEFVEDTGSYNIVIDEFWYKIGNEEKFTKYPLNSLMSYQNTILLQVPNGKELSFKVSFKDDYSMDYVTVAGMPDKLEDVDGVYTYKVNRERIYVEMFTRQKYNISFTGDNAKVLDIENNNVDITSATTTVGQSTFTFKVVPAQGYTIKSVVPDIEDFEISRIIENDGWYCTIKAKSLLADNVNIIIDAQKTRKYQLSFNYPENDLQLKVTVGGEDVKLKNNKVRVADNQVIRFSLKNKDENKGIHVSYNNIKIKQPLFYNQIIQDENTQEVVYDYYLGCLEDGSLTVNATLTDMCDISFAADMDKKYSIELYKPYEAVVEKNEILKIPKGYEISFGINDSYEYGSVYATTSDDEGGRLESVYSQKHEKYVYFYTVDDNKELKLVYEPAKLRFSYDIDEIQDMVILKGGRELELDANNDLSYMEVYNITLKVKPQENRMVRVGHYIYEEEDYKTLAVVEYDRIDADGYYYYNIGTTDAHCITIECPMMATVEFGEELDRLGIELMESFDGEDEYYDFTKLGDSTYTCCQGQTITFAVNGELDKGMAIVASAQDGFDIIPGNYNEAFDKIVYEITVTQNMEISPEVMEVVG